MSSAPLSGSPSARPVKALAAAVLALWGAASPVAAETLMDALAHAYVSNPTLAAQRAQQRSLDEIYVQARAGWDPSVNFSGNASWARTDLGKGLGQQLISNGIGGYTVTSAGGHYDINYGSGQLSVTQPLYTGGRVAYTVKSSEAIIESGRQTLRSVETQVLLSVITAYEDMLRDLEIERIRRGNIDVLQGQLTAVKGRLDAGRVTRIDVAQAETQMAQARSLLAIAQAQLEASRASYVAVVGDAPGQLEPPPPLPGLPATVDEALDAADAVNPNLLGAKATELASRARIGQARAAYRPTISLQGSYGYDGALQPFTTQNYERQITGQVVISQPLFAGGAIASGVRQAVEQNASDRINIETTRRATIQQVAQSWSALAGSKISLAANEEQLRNAELAFEGVKEKYGAGLETTIDLLLQQQTLENAQLTLAQTRHDAYLASATLLSVVGRLEGPALVHGVKAYDPKASFNRIKDRGGMPWDPLIAAVDAVALSDAPPPERAAGP